MTSTQTTRIRYRKADGRYYVAIDGTDVGWVLRNSDGTWVFYATIREALRGEILSTGERTRRAAVRDGLSCLRIRYWSEVVVLNMDRVKSEVVCIDDLETIEDALLDEMYPRAAASR